MTHREIIRYATDVNRAYQIGDATEHTYRPALQKLLENLAKESALSMMKDLIITNEPKRRTDCGAPDYRVSRKGVAVGYIEAKDIGAHLDDKAHREQFDRYKQAIDNIIFTDYLEFRRYVRGEPAGSARIAEINDGKIVPVEAGFGDFERLIAEFGTAQPQPIVSSAEIAKMMAGKARLMAEIIEKAINFAGKNPGTDSALKEQMEDFRNVLIKDITPKLFADVYAQTIAYGLFAARLHDGLPDTFSRKKAADLIPKTNPFLRSLFENIAGVNLDENISQIVDDLADTLRIANLAETKERFGERVSQDPIIHFYEIFLSEYDPSLRKSRGVWYTPQPVVSFIVGAVDEILQKEFGLPDGLADISTSSMHSASKTESNDIVAKVKNKSGGMKDDAAEPDKAENKAHKIQILDPAAGTGAFLAEVVTLIAGKIKAHSAGTWQSYVKNDLIPRLNGFEILMASYTIAHTKLELLLEQTGYRAAADGQRLRVYLTNSLEDAVPKAGTPILVREARGANDVKHDTPIMVVIGNPPYSGESQNKGEWIARLMDDYKKEPPADSALQKSNPDSWLELHEQSAHSLYERNSKWINDDYCKFIRLGQYFVDKNNEGVLAYINNHSFLDNPTFRGMRWSLLKSFDKIYIIDLHGNSRKKEVCPDGSADENVFDIQQGVSINIFVKTGKKKRGELAEVYHLDLYGKRKEKYKYLLDHKFSKIKFTKLRPSAPEYFFVPKDYVEKKEYEKGFGVQELFPVNSLGLITKRDNLSVSYTEKELMGKIKFFIDENNSIRDVCDHFEIPLMDNDKWNASTSRKMVNIKQVKKYITGVLYRPFDERSVFYNEWFVARLNKKTLKHLQSANHALIIGRQGQVVGDAGGWNIVFITKSIVDQNVFYRGGGTVFPLYLYHDTDKKLSSETRKPNLDESIVAEISNRTGLQYVEEKETGSYRKIFAPIDVLDYVYAVLHSPSYRECYKEFLKIDFPRIPYPKDADQFRRLAKLGEELRGLHLLEGVEPRGGIADFQISGSGVVEKIVYEDVATRDSGDSVGADIIRPRRCGKVYINDKQYFDGVPPEAWGFRIGGYQVAQKWLKDRKGRILEHDDVQHYRRIIWALTETVRVMGEIDLQSERQ